MRASRQRPELFEVVFERHHGRIWAYLARMGGRNCADELAADVFLVAFSRRESYEPSRGSVQAWLYGIAANRYRTRYRSEARAARAFRRAVGQQLAAGTISPTDDVVDALANRERLDRVLQAMARLPAGDREVIVLYAWERLPYQTIAEALGVEIGTVRSRLSRARRRLRELAGANGEVTNASSHPETLESEAADG